MFYRKNSRFRVRQTSLFLLKLSCPDSNRKVLSRNSLPKKNQWPLFIIHYKKGCGQYLYNRWTIRRIFKDVCLKTLILVESSLKLPSKPLKLNKTESMQLNWHGACQKYGYSMTPRQRTVLFLCTDILFESLKMVTIALAF